MGATIETLVIGGGIAGLACALALTKKGKSVTLFEQRTLHDSVGAGIQVSPNAARVLQALGLEAELRPHIATPRSIRVLSHARGVVAEEIPLGAVALRQYGAPYWHIRRGDLINALAAQLKASPLALIEENVTVAEFQPGASSSEVRLGDDRVVEAGCVIAADGIHSTFASQLANGAEPVFTGQTAWRAIIEVEEPADDVTHLWVGPGAHVVHYPLGKRHVNLIACVEQDEWQETGWRIAGRTEDLAAAFANWDPRVRQLLEQTREPYRWALFDRPPLDRYSIGTTIAIGDAAHPMLPFAAQGGAQAIEDGWLLAELLATRPIDSALLKFEQLRKPRVDRVATESLSRAAAYHSRGIGQRLKQLRQHWRQRQTGEHGFDDRFAWLYGYDITQWQDQLVATNP